MCKTDSSQTFRSGGRNALQKPWLRRFHWLSYSERRHCRDIRTLPEKYNGVIFIGWTFDVAKLRF
jgi:hypothetical protein